MIGRKGRDLVSIPLPQLDVPHFRYGKNGSRRRRPGRRRRWARRSAGGGRAGRRQGQAGSDPGAHILEVDVSLEELAEILGDELELPRIEPQGQSEHHRRKRARYTSIRRTGPESLRHFKRTYMEALRRQISSNTYDADDPRVVPIREDKRYRSWTTTPLPQTNAVVIYMMDVSGSMTDEQKQIVRTAGVLARYLAGEPIRRRRSALHHPRRGGQRSRRRDVLSHPRKRRHADQLGLQSLRRSDQAAVSAVANGTSTASSSPTATTGAKTTSKACDAARGAAAAVNLFCYGQVESPYGSGEYIRALRAAFGDDARKADPRGNRKQRRHLRLDQVVSRKRKVRKRRVGMAR